jgi:prepilin-type N-terminal cleavage/methylation domain-containing protein
MARSSLPIPGAVRKPPPLATRGFTLIELMIVVVIVGVLATLGVVGFRKLVGNARTTEATGMIQAIKSAQEAYHAETGTYADISANLCVDGTTSCASLYPQVTGAGGPGNVGNFKTQWGASSAGSTDKLDWLQLPVHTVGAVMYGYSTVAGIANQTTSLLGGVDYSGGFTLNSSQATNIQIVVGTFAKPTADWYMITATGDEDGDGVACVVLGTSLSNDLVIAGDGN